MRPREWLARIAALLLIANWLAALLSRLRSTGRSELAWLGLHYGGTAVALILAWVFEHCIRRGSRHQPVDRRFT